VQPLRELNNQRRLALALITIAFCALAGGLWLANALGPSDTTVIATASGPITLGTDPVGVTLVPPPELAARGETLASRLMRASGQRVYLAVKGLRTGEQPGVLYHLYLQLSPSAKPAKDDARYVGSFNFFSAGEFAGQAPNSAPTRTYDVTAVVQKLRDQRLLQDPITVTIVPGGSPAAQAKPTIAAIELVEQ
jgi:hypothetical protein